MHLSPCGLGCCPFYGGGSVVDSLLIVTFIVGLFNCSMFSVWCALQCPFLFAIISMGKRELVALLCLYSWCLVIVVCFSSRYTGLSAVCDCGIP